MLTLIGNRKQAVCNTVISCSNFVILDGNVNDEPQMQVLTKPLRMKLYALYSPPLLFQLKPYMRKDKRKCCHGDQSSYQIMYSVGRFP